MKWLTTIHLGTQHLTQLLEEHLGGPSFFGRGVADDS
jgi:hypothetical protein